MYGKIIDYGVLASYSDYTIPVSLHSPRVLIPISPAYRIPSVCILGVVAEYFSPPFQAPGSPFTHTIFLFSTKTY